MTEAGNTTKTVHQPTALGGYATAILTGLLIAAAGLVPWILLAPANARVRPDVPWAAVASVAYLVVLLAWLNGSGPPRSTARRRRQRLRLWPRRTPDETDTSGLTAEAVVALLGLPYVLWIMVGRLSPIPDLSAFPTTSYRWSMFRHGRGHRRRRGGSRVSWVHVDWSGET